MSVHTDREYEAELARLRERLLRMAGRVEEMIERAVRSVAERNAALAQTTIMLDQRVNADEVDIDELCLTILARRQPLASDLRFIALSLKMVTDLERIGDLAVNICERALQLASEAPLLPVETIPRMATLAQGLVKEAMDVFVARDADRAHALITRDDELDALYRRTLHELLERMRADPALLQRGIHMQAVAKLLERIGDHATNIAEEVVFLVKGKDIRHVGKRAAETEPT